MRSRAIAPFLLTLAIASGGYAQSAEPGTVPIVGAIDVRVSDPCLDVRILAEQITRWLERDTIDARIGVLIRASSSGSGESIEVIREGTVVAERTFDAGTASCTERQAALGLLIAMALDATLAFELEVPSETAPEAAPPPPEPVAAPTRVLALEVAGGGAFGLLPETAGGGRVMLELALMSIFTLRAGAGVDAVRAIDLERGRASATLVAGRVEACAGASSGRFRAEGCAAMLAGTVLARGRGFTENAREAMPFFAMALGAAGRARLSDAVTLRLSVDLVMPIVRAELAVTDVEGTPVALRRPSPVAATLGFGIVFSFR